jgi:uncharacterized ion transporter superfamily protein YfcC
LCPEEEPHVRRDDHDQSANGIMNLFIPTSAVVMGGLAIAQVPYGTYPRWVWPLLALLAGLSVLALGVGALLS